MEHCIFANADTSDSILLSCIVHCISRVLQTMHVYWVNGFYLFDAYMHSVVFAVKKWTAGCLSHADIVSKRIKISNFFLDLVALQLWFANTALRLRNSNWKGSLSVRWTYKFSV